MNPVSLLPHLVLHDKKEKTSLLITIAIPDESNFNTKNLTLHLGLGTSYNTHKAHTYTEGFCFTYAKHMNNNILITSLYKWDTQS